MKKRNIIIVAIACVAFVTLSWTWIRLLSPTRIAFVNYQAITLGQIAQANDNPFVKLKELPLEDLGDVPEYDMVMVNGMGLRITEEQRRLLSDAARNGTPVLTTAATNPQNMIVSVDSVDASYLAQYLSGGKNNYRNMLRYVRRIIDGKLFMVEDPGDPETEAMSLIYYPSGEGNKNFGSVGDYERFLSAMGKFDADAPHVVLTGRMGVPDSLVTALERTGNVVYPVHAVWQFIAGGHADSIGASAVINMAHGRLGDKVVGYLRQKNIPLFAPLNVNRPYTEWMEDHMGMSGGFLSQSVVTPEIDGSVRPFALFAHYNDDEGLPYVAAIPDRLEEFVATVNNYTALQGKTNAEKKVAVFYFKGPGQNALVAEGMDVAKSLYNMLRRMREEGYKVDGLPSSAGEFECLVNENGRVFNSYAHGAKAGFVRSCSPELVSRQAYEEWCARALPSEMRDAVDATDGSFPGHGLSAENGDLALARLSFGNVVLIPQTAAGLGDDDFRIVHGTDAAPPHNYVAAYLWARYGFGADALMHFGAHGSLEFTPRTQVALGSNDWPDRLVGTLPHFYVYSTSNVGEAMIAKRRSYATVISHLTPPFMESGVRGIYRNLTDAIAGYNRVSESGDADAVREAALKVKQYTVELGINRELRLDSLMTQPYSPDDIVRVENFAEELANEKITGALYEMGVPYDEEHIVSTVYAMTIDPVAYSLYALDRRLGRTSLDYERDRSAFNRIYVAGARSVVGAFLSDARDVDDAEVCRVTRLTPLQLDSARRITANIEGPADVMSWMRMMGAMSGQTDVREYSRDEIEFAGAVAEVERALKNVRDYRKALAGSPEAEMRSVLNALAGGYVSPASGGDPVLNPDILPTGRNMFAVNAEETPSAVAWEKGKMLAENTISMYRKAHGDSIPRKVSYTLWSGEFIETEGATIAQVLYMLGVEPVRDPFGRVTDLRLIPSDRLGRPRIDVVVQTSGQLRDLAASRLFLISRAVKMAAEAEDDRYPNYVAEGVRESERHLVDRGVTPKEARDLAAARVFGGVDGNYGSGIQGLVEAGDRWENESEIAMTYIGNMGAFYGSEKDWEKMCDFAFEAALTRTDVVVQPRQSNTWGALSLDHVYEFMGGMNLAVRNVTGKDPDAYLSDYRNRNHARMQEVKEAIGAESRTTVLNPAYIREKMGGGAGDASAFADVIRNTYGWNVMKPDAVDDELWDDIYDVYVADRYGLGMKDYFTSVNPAAIEEITAVMLETVRKGMWNATEEQVGTLAAFHAELIGEYGASCSGFVCDNALLRDFISSKIPADAAGRYNRSVADIRGEDPVADGDGVVMRKESLSETEHVTGRVNGIVVGAVVLVVLVLAGVMLRRRNKDGDIID